MNRNRHQALSCAEVQDILEAYLGSELDTSTDTRVTAHLADCPNCQDEVRIAHALDEVLDELPSPEPPPEIFREVAAYVRAHPDGRGWLYRLKTVLRDIGTRYGHPLVRVGALTCFVGLFVFGVYQHQQQQAEIAQATRDFNYAFSTVQYAVERTGIVINERLAAVQLDEASRRALKRTANVSSAIQRSFGILSGLTGTASATEHPQRSNQKGDTR